MHNVGTMHIMSQKVIRMMPLKSDVKKSIAARYWFLLSWRSIKSLSIRYWVIEVIELWNENISEISIYIYPPNTKRKVEFYICSLFKFDLNEYWLALRRRNDKHQFVWACLENTHSTLVFPKTTIVNDRQENEFHH